MSLHDSSTSEGGDQRVRCAIPRPAGTFRVRRAMASCSVEPQTVRSRTRNPPGPSTRCPHYPTKPTKLVGRPLTSTKSMEHQASALESTVLEVPPSSERTCTLGSVWASPLGGRRGIPLQSGPTAKRRDPRSSRSFHSFRGDPTLGSRRASRCMWWSHCRPKSRNPNPPAPSPPSRP